MKSTAAYLKNVSTLELFEDRCTGCGMCSIVCPHGVFTVSSGCAAIIDRDACMECSACKRNCPEGAIHVQTGVGCAQAVINSVLGRNSACCCNLEGCETPGPEYGPVDEDGTAPVKKSPGCC